MLPLHWCHCSSSCPLSWDLVNTINSDDGVAHLVHKCAKVNGDTKEEGNMEMDSAPALTIKNNPPSQEEWDKAFHAAQDDLNDTINIVIHYDGEHVRDSLMLEIEEMKKDVKVNPESYPEFFMGTKIVVNKFTLLDYLTNAGF